MNKTIEIPIKLLEAIANANMHSDGYSYIISESLVKEARKILNENREVG